MLREMLEEGDAPMLGAGDAAGDGNGDASGDALAASAPGWPGGAVGLLLSTLEETLAALDWVLQGGDAALAPPLCQVCSSSVEPVSYFE